MTTHSKKKISKRVKWLYQGYRIYENEDTQGNGYTFVFKDKKLPTI